MEACLKKFIGFTLIHLISIAEVRAGDLVPRDPDRCAGEISGRAQPTGTVAVVVGYLEDGTPIVQKMAATRAEITPAAAVVPSRELDEPARPGTGLSRDRLLGIVDQMRADRPPSHAALHELMSAAITGVVRYDTDLIRQALSRTDHPLAVVWLVHMLFLQRRLDVVTDDQWRLVCKVLDNSDTEEIPDWALTSARAAVEVLLNAPLSENVRPLAARELRKSAKYETDFGVRFIAGVGHYVHGGERNATIDNFLRDNLRDPRIPEYIRQLAERLLYSDALEAPGTRQVGNPTLEFNPPAPRGLGVNRRELEDRRPRDDERD